MVTVLNLMSVAQDSMEEIKKKLMKRFNGEYVEMAVKVLVSSKSIQAHMTGKYYRSFMTRIATIALFERFAFSGKQQQRPTSVALLCVNNNNDQPVSTCMHTLRHA